MILDYLDRSNLITWIFKRRALPPARVREMWPKGKSERFKEWEGPGLPSLAGRQMLTLWWVGLRIWAALTDSKETGVPSTATGKWSFQRGNNPGSGFLPPDQSTPYFYLGGFGAEKPSEPPGFLTNRTMRNKLCWLKLLSLWHSVTTAIENNRSR